MEPADFSFLDAIVINDPQPIEVPITINWPKPKGECKYVLREASEQAAVAFKNVAIKSAKMADGQVVGMGDLADAEIMLLSLCLFELYPVNQGGKVVVQEKPVPQGELKSWNHRMVKPIFERLKKISELDEVDTVDSLRKRIARDTEKLDKLLAAGAKDGAPKNSPDGSPTISGSAENSADPLTS